PLHAALLRRARRSSAEQGRSAARGPARDDRRAAAARAGSGLARTVFLGAVRPDGQLALGACRALGWARAEASRAASQGAGEACGGPTQRAGNAGWRRDSPRPEGLGPTRSPAAS